MSQRVVILTISNDEYTTIHIGETSIPDREDVESLAKGYELFGEVECQYEWYEIGEGESDTDSFFDDDEIDEMYKKYNGDFEKSVEEKGYVCDIIERGTINVDVEREDD